VIGFSPAQERLDGVHRARLCALRRADDAAGHGPDGQGVPMHQEAGGVDEAVLKELIDASVAEMAPRRVDQ
jgi:hypothetical protein